MMQPPWFSIYLSDSIYLAASVLLAAPDKERKRARGQGLSPRPFWPTCQDG